MKSRYKVLAIVFGIFALGAIKETHRIFTSNAQDIAQNRSSLMPMSIIFSVLLIGLSFYFWKKHK